MRDDLQGKFLQVEMLSQREGEFKNEFIFISDLHFKDTSQVCSHTTITISESACFLRSYLYFKNLDIELICVVNVFPGHFLRCFFF